jgi:hypothetical protein
MQVYWLNMFRALVCPSSGVHYWVPLSGVQTCKLSGLCSAGLLCVLHRGSCHFPVQHTQQLLIQLVFVLDIHTLQHILTCSHKSAPILVPLTGTEVTNNMELHVDTTTNTNCILDPNFRLKPLNFMDWMRISGISGSTVLFHNPIQCKPHPIQEKQQIQIKKSICYWFLNNW